MQSLKVLCYNIHKGFSTGNRKYILDMIRESIREYKADLVLLQEVLGENEKHKHSIQNYPTTSQFEFLADGVWSHYAYGKNAVYDEGHHGNAILSLYPIKGWNNLDLTTNRWESRGLLHATLETPLKKTVHVLSLHLDLLEKNRMKQIRKVCDYVNEKTKPEDIIILGGDFNDWTEKVGDKLKQETGLEESFFQMHGYHARSYPSLFPVLRLDRIYSRNLKPKSAQCLKGKVWSQLSDHLALFTEYEV